jgi:recombination DNA repair RAD52 pathway protein
MEEDRETGRVNLGLSVIVRVTLPDGIFHEDIGYGSIDKAKSKAAAFEKVLPEYTSLTSAVQEGRNERRT